MRENTVTNKEIKEERTSDSDSDRENMAESSPKSLTKAFGKAVSTLGSSVQTVVKNPQPLVSKLTTRTDRSNSPRRKRDALGTSTLRA